MHKFRKWILDWGRGGAGTAHAKMCLGKKLGGKEVLISDFFFHLYLQGWATWENFVCRIMEGICPPAFKIWGNLVVEQWQLNRGHVRSPARKSDIGQRFPQLDVTFSGADEIG